MPPRGVRRAADAGNPPSGRRTSGGRRLRLAGMAISRLAAVAWGWAVFLAAMGVFWTLGGPGYPLGGNDIDSPAYTALLSAMERRVGGPVITLVGVMAGFLALHVKRQRRSATVVAIALIAVVADGRLILLLPPLGLLPFAWPDADWPTIFQVIMVTGATPVSRAPRSSQRTGRNTRRRFRTASPTAHAPRAHPRDPGHRPKQDQTAHPDPTNSGTPGTKPGVRIYALPSTPEYEPLSRNRGPNDHAHPPRHSSEA